MLEQKIVELEGKLGVNLEANDQILIQIKGLKRELLKQQWLKELGIVK
jgi:hypothetical protein